jgi:hypothetical protein
MAGSFGKAPARAKRAGALFEDSMNRCVVAFPVALLACAGAYAQNSLLDNKIRCTDFRKIDSKTWTTTREARFDIGKMKGNGLPPNIVLGRGVFELDGTDLVDVLESTCAAI